MTKQHFEWAASYVRFHAAAATDDAGRREVACMTAAFVDLFRQWGPRFDQARFLTACQPRGR